MTRFLDIIISGFSIVVLVPLLIPIVFLLLLTGEHDVFYLQPRVGKDGRIFNVIKFATMLRNSPNLEGGLITAPKDPRLLPMGRFLRNTKLNELPQLLNVFAGQMSLVGYRPFAKPHYDLYSSEIKAQINKTRPGLTGLGSIVFKNEEAMLHAAEDRTFLHDHVITPYKGNLESWYVDHASVANYLALIVFTVIAFVRPAKDLVYRYFRDLPKCPEELERYL